jgi:hypothetical protein
LAFPNGGVAIVQVELPERSAAADRSHSNFISASISRAA